jgi:hypothetical protein
MVGEMDGGATGEEAASEDKEAIGRLAAAESVGSLDDEVVAAHPPRTMAAVRSGHSFARITGSEPVIRSPRLPRHSCWRPRSIDRRASRTATSTKMDAWLGGA